jgi:hypothetical protein
VRAALEIRIRVLPSRQDGQSGAFQIDDGESGIGFAVPKPRALVVDLVCVGLGSVEVEVFGSQGRRLSDLHSLACHTDGSAVDPVVLTINFVLDSGEVMIHVRNPDDANAVLAYQVSPQGV